MNSIPQCACSAGQSIFRSYAVYKILVVLMAPSQKMDVDAVMQTHTIVWERYTNGTYVNTFVPEPSPSKGYPGFAHPS